MLIETSKYPSWSAFCPFHDHFIATNSSTIFVTQCILYTNKLSHSLAKNHLVSVHSLNWLPNNQLLISLKNYPKSHMWLELGICQNSTLVNASFINTTDMSKSSLNDQKTALSLVPIFNPDAHHHFLHSVSYTWNGKHAPTTKDWSTIRLLQ